MKSLEVNFLIQSPQGRLGQECYKDPFWYKKRERNKEEKNKRNRKLKIFLKEKNKKNKKRKTEFFDTKSPRPTWTRVLQRSVWSKKKKKEKRKGREITKRKAELKQQRKEKEQEKKNKRIKEYGTHDKIEK